MVHLLRAIAGTLFASIRVVGRVYSVAGHFVHIGPVRGQAGRGAAIKVSRATQPMRVGTFAVCGKVLSGR